MWLLPDAFSNTYNYIKIFRKLAYKGRKYQKGYKKENT